MVIKEGQVYENCRSQRLVRVCHVDPLGYRGNLRPSAWVENVFGPKRGRWVVLKSLHTDGKARRSGYRLLLESADGLLHKGHGSPCEDDPVNGSCSGGIDV